MEGPWAGTEPERRPRRVRASPDQSLSLQVPGNLRAGESFRVILVDSAEPPSPAGGVRLSLFSASGERAQSFVTNDAGEARFRVDRAGDYELRIERPNTSPTRISVLP